MQINADQWVESWELQQNLEIKNREERFRFMFEAVENYAGRRARVLDLACGPGSLGGRFTSTYPGATSIGVDYDPVLLFLANNFSRYDHSRMSFVEADIGTPGWTVKVRDIRFQAVMSTTALHWLPEESLKKVYADIYNVLGKDGIFMNGDHLYPEGESNEILELFNKIRHSHKEKEEIRGPGMTWDQWWKALEKEDEIHPLLEERKKRYPQPDRHNHKISLQQHMEFLKLAGFKSVEVGWQYLDNRVLIALK